MGRRLKALTSTRDNDRIKGRNKGTASEGRHDIEMRRGEHTFTTSEPKGMVGYWLVSELGKITDL